MDKERRRTSPFYTVMTVIMTAVSVVVAALIVATLLSDEDEGLAYGVQSVATSSNVSTEVAEVGDFSIYTKLYGDIVTDNAPVAQFSDVEGTVTEVLVHRGDSVSEGDILAYVDQSRPGYSYTPSPVRASVSGEVLSVSVASGDHVTTATELMEVRFDEDLKISTSVTERNLGSLALGGSASFSVIAYPEATYTASIEYISPVVDTSTRSAQISLDIDGEHEELKEGMFATIELETARYEDVITVDDDALATDNIGTYVLVVEDGVAVKRHVETGEGDGQRTVITSGLEAGDEVIVSGSASEGAAVTVVEAFE